MKKVQIEEFKQMLSRLSLEELDAFLLLAWYLDGQRGPVGCTDIQKARHKLTEAARAAAQRGYTDLAAVWHRAVQASQQSHGPQ